MKKLLLLFTTILSSVNIAQAQCDLDTSFTNTGSNMTIFFTPPAASSIYAELGDGALGAFYIDPEGAYVCAASAPFSGAQIQLAVMADDATTPDKDGFASGEAINWFYFSSDGRVSSLVLSPNDNYVTQGISFISSASTTTIDCGGSDNISSGEACPSLDFTAVNTGANMTLFITNGNLLSELGDGTVGVYFIDENGNEVCGGSASYSGDQVLIPTYGDDSTTDEKDGFAANEAIIWKFEDINGNQYNLTPSPSDLFTLNSTSFIVALSYDAIFCEVDTVEGCTDSAYLEYNANANVDDGSCSSLIVEGCTNDAYVEYTASANTDDGSCVDLVVNGCIDAAYTEYSAAANTDDGSCATAVVYGCTDGGYTEYSSSANTDDGSCTTAVVAGCTDTGYTEYSADANTDDGSCATAVVLGCTDASFTEYSAAANTDDGSCLTINLEGCMDSTACNFNSNATTDDSSCYNNDVGCGCDQPAAATEYDCSGVCLVDSDGDGVCDAFEIVGCQDPLADNFDSTATDSDVCIYLGCIDSMACNFDATANTTDSSCYNNDLGCGCDQPAAATEYDCSGVCLVDSDGDGVCDAFEIVGCQDPLADNFDSTATDIGACNYLGCTDELYIEYDSTANVDDGSCTTLIVTGCTDSTASNYLANANIPDGSCEYDLIGDGCSVSFSASNTGSNASVFIYGSAGGLLNVGDSIGVFYMAADGTAKCAGASAWLGSTTQIVAFGDDGTTDEKDGLATGDPYLMLAQSGDNVYLIEPSYVSASMGSYSVDDISMIIGLEFQLACTVEYLGCTDALYLEYDSTSNVDDGSCSTLIVTGCTDSTASNYLANANIPDGSCEYDLIGDGCSVSFSASNTGSNASVFISASAGGLLNVGDSIGVFYMASDGTAQCAGASAWLGSTTQIVAFGDDGTTDEKDGLSPGDPYLMLAQSGDNVYLIEPSYVSASMGSFSVDDISMIIGLEFQLACTVEYPGCTDINACNYDSTANTNDGTCYNNDLGCGCDLPAPESGYDCNGLCLSDSDGDEICDPFEISGCQDSNAINFDSTATDPGHCDYLGCTDSTACNFDANVTIDNASCYNNDVGCGCDQPAAETGYDCAGVCLLDSDGDGVCDAFEVLGCQDPLADNFDSTASDAGFCIYLGCIDSMACNFDATANTTDNSCYNNDLGCGCDQPAAASGYDCSGVCLVDSDGDSVCDAFEIVGCQDPLAYNYDINATDSGDCDYQGCTDVNACNYDAIANIDDGSCYNNDLGCGCDQPAAATGYDCSGVCLLDSDGDGVCDAFEILGCLDTAAYNYDQYATESGICISWEQAYETCVESGGDDGIGQAEVDASYEYGVASVDVTSNDSTVYSNAYADGAASITPEDGVSQADVDAASTFSFAAGAASIMPEDGVSQSDVDAAAAAAYAEGAASITPEDGVSQSDVDAAATSAYAAGAASITPEDGISQADVDAAAIASYAAGAASVIPEDGIGQSDVDAAYASGAASVTPEDGVSQADLDAAVATANTSSNEIIANLQSQIDALQDNSNSDSFTQADIDAAYANGAASIDITSDNSAVSSEAYTFGYTDGYNQGEVDGDDGIGQTEVDAAYVDGAASVTPDDGIGQTEVDAAYTNGVNSVDITSDNSAVADAAYFSGYNNGYDLGLTDGDDGISQSQVDAAYANGVASVVADDGIGQVDVDAAFTNGAASVDITSDNQAVSDDAYTLGYSEGVASVNPEDGVSQADVDAAYASGAASVDITSDNVSVADEAYQFGYTDGAASVTPEDGASQANLDSLQVLLDEALANGGGSCEPIYIELLQGWNIMGYTLPFAQDVTATLAAVVDNVQIVKNNAAAVYWPEYSFNGIGDFIPGHGYQIRMLNALPNYTFPDVGGQRIELTPSVPEWVHDLPILNHPNDIKSLVRVVNLLGQEVDPEMQFKGEVLLYLYNDGSTEKRLAQ